MGTVTWTGSTDTDYGTAGNWDTGSVPTSSDDVIIANVSNDCVLDGSRSVNSFVVETGGDFNGNAETLTVVGENSSGFAVDIDGDIVGTNTMITITTPATTQIDIVPTSGNIRDLTINHASFIGTLLGHTTITRNLTITAGELKTAGSNDLTVAGATSVTGTLTCNASTVSLGSGKSDGYALTGNGTVNFGTGTITVGAVNTNSPSGITKTSGTITFNTQKTGGQSIGPSVSSNNSHFNFGTSTVNFDLSGGTGSNFAIEQHSGSSKTFTITAGSVNYKSNGYIYQNNTDTNIFKIIGDLVIDASKTLKTYFDNADDFGSKLEVTGDVTLNGTLNAYSASNPKPMDFGSIVIAGTYQATSGTTTITNEKSGHAWKNNGGTFTHNNGKVLFDFDTGNLAGSTEVKENTFYDLEVKLDDAAYELRLEDHSSTNAMDILNNLTVTKGIFDTMTKSDTLTIHGQTIIESDGVFTQADHDTNKIIHNGIVRNSGTYKINDGTTVKMNGGIRNLGTITVA